MSGGGSDRRECGCLESASGHTCKRKGDGLDRYIEERECRSPGFKTLVEETEVRITARPCRHPKAHLLMGLQAEWCPQCGSIRERKASGWGRWRTTRAM